MTQTGSAICISSGCGTKRLGDEFEAVVAEEHLMADEHGWCAEHPALSRSFGFGFQFRDDVLVACTLN